jgi:hypothetical protein
MPRPPTRFSALQYNHRPYAACVVAVTVSLLHTHSFSLNE